MMLQWNLRKDDIGGSLTAGEDDEGVVLDAQVADGVKQEADGAVHRRDHGLVLPPLTRNHENNNQPAQQRATDG